MSILFAILLFQTTARTYAWDEGIIKGDTLQIGPQGEYLVAHQDKLLQLMPDGTILSPLTTKMPIIDFLYDGDYYFISSFFEKPSTAVYNSTGNLISETIQEDQLADMFFAKTGSNIFCSLYRSPNEIDRKPFFFNACSLKLSFHDGSISTTITPTFCKITEKQHKLGYNFRKIWIVENSKSFLVMNQLQTQVFIYSPEARLKESRDGNRVPSVTAHHLLSLEKYIPPPDKPFGLVRPIKRSQYRDMFINWWNSWSRITWFGRLGDGYVVAYEIPDCAPEDRRNCTSTHLGIQRLDSSFQNRGMLIETEGKMMGVNPDGQICVFQSNPIEEDGKVVGCRPKILFWDPH